MHHVLGSDIDSCQVPCLQSHGRAPLYESLDWNLATSDCDGWLWWGAPVEHCASVCLEHLCQECHSSLHLPPEGKQINFVHCRCKLHSAQSFWKSHSPQRWNSPWIAMWGWFCPTWQNFMCMLDNANVLKLYVIRDSLQTTKPFLRPLYPFSPKEVFPPHDSFCSMANKRGMQ